MNKLSIFYLLAIAAALFLSACASNETANSDTVKQSEIYQSYSVSYDEASMELYASASFRFGGNKGTTLALVSPSKVSFNGEDMAQDNNMFSGTYYKIERQTSFPGSFTFVFIDTDKKKFTNSVSISQIAIADFKNTVNKTEQYTVGWSGMPVQNGESVTVVIESEANASRSKSTNIVGATNVTFSLEDLKELPSGQGSIYVERSADYSLQQASNQGGRISASYKSPKVAITIK